VEDALGASPPSRRQWIRTLKRLASWPWWSEERGKVQTSSQAPKKSLAIYDRMPSPLQAHSSVYSASSFSLEARIIRASRVLKKGISCFDGLSMNGNLSMNSKDPPFALSLVER
jgi:hypothetical protein